MKEISPPTNCPGCNSVLVRVNDLLYCKNRSCSQKLQKVISSFATNMKIKGLGPATISKLELSDISDIYALDENIVYDKLGSVPLTTKLLNQIEISKKIGLRTILSSFSIPLFGKTASEKLCSKINDITDITEQVLLEAGIGEKTTNNFMQWFENDYQHKYQVLPLSWKNAERSKVSTGPVVVITGKLVSFKTKDVAKTELQNKGYNVKTSITKDTKYLVNESALASAKTKKAEAMGIIIITDIKDLLEI